MFGCGHPGDRQVLVTDAVCQQMLCLMPVFDALLIGCRYCWVIMSHAACGLAVDISLLTPASLRLVDAACSWIIESYFVECQRAD